MTPPPNPRPETNPIRAFGRSFRFAWAGVFFLFATQRNARVHLAAAAAASLAALWLDLPSLHWAVLLLTFALILALEAMNTAIEAAVDLASPQHAPLAKVAKDVGAGAVLIAAIFSVAIGVLLFGPPLATRLGWLN